MSHYTRLTTPIRVGECYRNGTSCYKVLEAMPSIGEAILCRPSDGWTLLAHGAALYDTAEGEQLLWDYSTQVRFAKYNQSAQLSTAAAVGSLPPKSVFRYGGVNWLVLGHKNGNTSGVLCLAEKALFNKAFDDDNCNNWEDSSLREHLNNDFLEELVQSGATEAAFMPMTIDLTAEDGLTDYGTCEDIISLVSCQQYRQYRGIIPNLDNWWWICTAYSTKVNGYPCKARYVGCDGTLDIINAYNDFIGVRPFCTLQSSILVSVINAAEGEHLI